MSRRDDAARVAPRVRIGRDDAADAPAGAAPQPTDETLERRLAQCRAELAEALDYQHAVAEVLHVISGSMTDAKPVFETIMESAVRLFDAPIAAVFRYDGRLVHIEGTRGWSAQAIEDARRLYPAPPNPQMLSGRVILAGTELSVPDTRADPDYDATTARVGQWRRMIGAPMLRDGVPIGVIVIAWPDPGTTPQRQSNLLRTFADQAAIAIENVRLFHETRDALERQTATAEVLRAISASPDDEYPVLVAVAERAAVLSRAAHSSVLLADGEVLRQRAIWSDEPGDDPVEGHPVPIRRTLVNGRAFLERRTVHVEDVVPLLETEYPDARENQARLGFRTMLAVPMLREGRALGTIFIWRREVLPFSPAQIELLQTFADQAVIAIENVRLFNETRDALERQTATAEVLQVIGGSMADPLPVFDKILQSCQRLFESDELAAMRVGDDGQLHLAAALGPVGGRRDRGYVRPLAGSATELAIRERRVLHFADVLADPAVPDSLRRMCEDAGIRSLLMAPMLWAEHGVGSILVARTRRRPYGDKDIALLKTFADQAVVAIQNARHFNETREALEQQTATAEILQVISSSVADTQPVFEKILLSCNRLFDSSEQGVLLFDASGRLVLGDHHGSTRERLGDFFTAPVPVGDTLAAAIRERRVLRYDDVLGGADVPRGIREVARYLSIGNYSQAFAPMVWKGRAVGALYVIRQPAVGFEDKELGLLKTFADQAVIAIENARLFHEIEDKSRQLEIANRHKSEFLANMSHELRTPLNAIIGFSEVLSEQMFGALNDKQLEYLQDIHSSGQHLLTLINDVLDLSKIEAGRMELEPSRFDLGLLLDHSLTLVRERAQRHGLALTLEVGDGLDEWVADARKVKQVVVNLLSNAVKFTPGGGRVTVRARRVEDPDRLVAEVAVTDTGVGIAADEQALVFEEFRQASGDYLRKTEGTGLGLALAKRFVELHGGTIRVDSRRGAGATFTFTLPMQALEAVA